MNWRALALATVAALATDVLAQSAEVIAEVRIHGNYRTPDAEVLRLAGITLGQPIDSASLDAVVARLRKTGRFEDVEIRKRLKSLDASDQVALIIIVREFPSTAPGGIPAGPLKKLRDSVMAVPVLEGQDGTGVTYGGRMSFVGTLGKHGMLTVPLTWGGTRRATLEFDVTPAKGPVRRLSGGTGIISRFNPAYELRDYRRTLWTEVSTPSRMGFAVAGREAWAAVRFGTIDEHVMTGGVGLVLDTRANPSFPRNAVFASAWWTRVSPDAAGPANRFTIDARGYIGVVGTPVLAVRFLSDRSAALLPVYERPMLGGMDSLRGFGAGAVTGNNITAGSMELRLPWNSPMRLAQTGFVVFVDAGRAWERGGWYDAATTRVGYGAGWYATAPFVHLNVAVARGRESGTRIHIGASLKF